MNPYVILGSSVGTPEAASLCARLTIWHDAMVAHERRLRSGRTADTCDDDCPHVQARTLWSEALAALGPRARELTFLRSRAKGASQLQEEVVAPATAVSQAADTATPSSTTRERSVQRSKSFMSPSARSQVVTGEF